MRQVLPNGGPWPFPGGTMDRPAASEYAPYYERYVALVGDDVLAALEGQVAILERVAGSVGPERERYRYEDGKWSVRQVFGHLGDGERVFGYRASCIARGDQTAFPSFDEDAYVANGRFDEDSLRSLLDEFVHLRAANLATLRRLDEAGWRATGTASDKRVSVRALAFIMAGHVTHHLAILRDRYGITVD